MPRLLRISFRDKRYFRNALPLGAMVATTHTPMLAAITRAHMAIHMATSHCSNEK
jgi:hypothetical protein